MADNTWELMCIIGDFNKRIATVDEFSSEYDELKELYAQAIRVQCKMLYGFVMTVDDFIDSVKNGYYIDYDGTGCFADFNGKQYEHVYCDERWLKAHRKDYSFVFWYNK